jgi:hypothetical protein
MQSNMFRTVIATAAGILLAFALIWLAQTVGNAIDPVVAVPDAADPETLEIQIPLGSTLALLAGWLVGGFAGSWLAARASGIAATAWVVGGAVFGAGAVRAASLGEPWWMLALAFTLPLLGAWGAWRAVGYSASTAA